VSTAAPPAHGETREAITPVYVWDLVVRSTHWLIFGSIVVLSATGIYIGRPFLTLPGQASQHFVMGTIRFIHFIAAIVFTLSVLLRIGWMFTGSRYARWSQFVPTTKERRAGLVKTLRFYLFLDRTPPPFAGHNPLAGAAYLLVFGLYLVMIFTGLGIYALSASVSSPVRGLGFLAALFGGAQQARWIHHMVMWLLLGFAVHHVYSAWLVSIVEKNSTLGSIFTGVKFLRKEQDVPVGERKP